MSRIVEEKEFICVSCFHMFTQDFSKFKLKIYSNPDLKPVVKCPACRKRRGVLYKEYCKLSDYLKKRETKPYMGGVNQHAILHVAARMLSKGIDPTMPYSTIDQVINNHLISLEDKLRQV